MAEFRTFTASDGTPIEYAGIGSGPVLLNIHHYGGSTEMQMPLLEMLADEFRCITFSQRGWGATPLQGEISLYRSARDAAELLDHLGIDDAYFVGLSMGAAVTWAYVELFGCARMNRAFFMDMTPKLVNSDGFDAGLYQGWYTPEHYATDLALQAEDMTEFTRYFYEQVFFPHTRDEERTFRFDESLLPIFEQMMPAAGFPAGTTVERLFEPEPGMLATLQEYWKAMGDADLRTALTRFTVPVMLLFARPGSIYDERTAEFVRDAIPGAHLEYVDGATHMSFLVQELPRAVQAITEFARAG